MHESHKYNNPLPKCLDKVFNSKIVLFYSVRKFCDYIVKAAQCTKFPLCAGFGEGPDDKGLFVRNLTLYFYKRLFSRLEHVTSRSRDNNFISYTNVSILTR